MTNLFAPLYNDLAQNETFSKKLLVHYTSIPALENIMRTNEIWFSNPLLMNDIEELRFGILESTHRFFFNSNIQEACGSVERFNILSEHFDYYMNIFENKHAFDTYVFCLSEHKKDNDDGILSMWRGYGANGNGVAIVFDGGKINENQSSPIIIDKVQYASKQKRYDWIDNKFMQFSKILKEINLTDDQLYLAAYALFERIKLFALFTKHSGFSEEEEWRAVYSRERDEKNYLESMLSYTQGKNILEPKLKFKIEPINGLTSNDLSLNKIVDKIILGPAISGELTKKTVERMLDKVGKSDLKTKLVLSTIPFRAT